jgi:hypothetical protein
MEQNPLPHAHSGSNVTHWAHDPVSNKLRLKFGQTGKVAEYDDVSTQEAAELVAAPSHGHHFAKKIKGKKAWRYV